MSPKRLVYFIMLPAFSYVTSSELNAIKCSEINILDD